MNIVINILVAAVVLGGLGLLFGIILGVASKIFEVHKDERIAKIMEVIPCANCGGCGFAGCSAFAQAVVDGKAKPSGCSVGGSSCAECVSGIMGIKADFVKKVARVKCSATCEQSPMRYRYKGLEDCKAAARLGGGPRACSHGCTGIGSCVQVCQFGAISIENGVAIVDEEKCGGCGKCASVCPKKLIEIVPQDMKYFVACNSKDKGSEMKELCSAGCIGCKLCEKACESEAVSVENNLAVIDAEKCTSCGACAEKCPKKIIKSY